MSAEHAPATGCRRLLEETFFRDLDAMLISRLHAEAESPQGRERLVGSIGVNDEVLLEELTALGVTAEGLIAVQLVPLILVAWADPKIEQEERRSMMREAEKLGIVVGSVPSVLLEEWLRKHPPREILDAWKRYVRSILVKMTPETRHKFIELTREQMTRIAEASGGRFGFGTVSTREQQMIRGLTEMLVKEH
ncbi:hypothetical protein [Novipirellula artificiosorum]|uniref:Tellurite resistance protein TerB n=1 Tax=Novipirellula artificiosorum TaxID=2528016 RepID=A0A5C6D4F4_9BACT|nr:hypothetical protein [Novipirellula artificiosorum]TWU30547.1 hypothetical protein Poly41_66420 [Novipirellula artificiosorum]